MFQSARDMLACAAFGLGLAAGFFTPLPVLAHPHVWVMVNTEVQFDENRRITGFRHTWTFDEVYTAFAVQGLDVNQDGVYSPEELAPLAKVNIESLSEYDYFTFARSGDEALRREDPVDYHLVYEDGLLVLHFTLPLASPLPEDKTGSFNFSVYDPTYFVAFDLAQSEPVQLSASAPAGCTSRITPAPSTTWSEQSLSEAFFDALDPNQDWGSQFAQKVALDCSTG